MNKGQLHKVLLTSAILATTMTTPVWATERVMAARGNREAKVGLEERGDRVGQRFVRIPQGEVKSVGADFLTVFYKDKTYQVGVDEKTRIFGKYWNKIGLSDIKLADSVSISGTTTSEDGLSVRASLIRDMSNSYRYWVGRGDVSGVDTNKKELIVSNAKFNSLVVEIGDDTKLRDANNKDIVLTDIKVGDKVGYRGWLNEGDKRVTKTKLVTDWSIKS